MTVLPPSAPPPPPPDAFAALGLGVVWQPSPAQISWAKLHAPGGAVVHVMTVDTMAGRFGVVLDADSLRSVIRSAEQEMSGLVLPR